MKTKERLLKELDNLSQRDIMQVYDLVLALKQQDKPNKKEPWHGYLRVRQALKNCHGSLSDDIREERNERV